MNAENLKYVIIDAADVSSITGWGGQTILETSEDTLRWNVDPAFTKALVKFPAADPTPSFLEGKKQFTHSEILIELATSEWTPEPP